MRNYFKFGPVVLENMLDKSCFSIFFNSGVHFVQKSRTNCAILKKGSMRNISVKLFGSRNFGIALKYFNFTSDSHFVS